RRTRAGVVAIGGSSALPSARPQCKRLHDRVILQDPTMKLLRALVAVFTLLLVTFSARASFDAAQDTRKTVHDYPVQPVPFTAVHLTDVFWAPRIETNRKVTIPAAFQKCEESGRVNNFERA